mgnify:CR=1 FL=1
MKAEIFKSEERGSVDIGWLKSHHSFSFGDYYNPKRMGFRSLRVINDDYIAPAKGFGSHPHSNMEIVTIVLSGELEHKDSLGNGSTIKPGEVQLMSAGRRIVHSEFNKSQDRPLTLLQIWLHTNQPDLSPTYQQRDYSERMLNNLALVVSPDAVEDSLSINQDAKIYFGNFDTANDIVVNLEKDRFGYLHIAEGEVRVAGMELRKGDAFEIGASTDKQIFNIQIKPGAKLLFFDLA